MHFNTPSGPCVPSPRPRASCAAADSVFVATWGRAEDSEAMAYIAAVNSVLPPSPPGPGPFALSNPRALEAVAAETGLKLGPIVDVDVPFAAPVWTWPFGECCRRDQL